MAKARAPKAKKDAKPKRRRKLREVEATSAVRAELLARLRETLLRAISVDLTNPSHQAYALKTLAVFLGEVDPSTRPVKRVLFAIADLLADRNVAALKRETRPRSIAAWAKSQAEQRHGKRKDRIIAALDRSLVSDLPDDVLIVRLLATGEILLTRDAATINEDRQNARARLQKLLARTSANPKARDAETVARVISGKKDWGSFASKRVKRK